MAAVPRLRVHGGGGKVWNLRLTIATRLGEGCWREYLTDDPRIFPHSWLVAARELLDREPGGRGEATAALDLLSSLADLETETAEERRKRCMEAGTMLFIEPGYHAEQRKQHLRTAIRAHRRLKHDDERFRLTKILEEITDREGK